MSELSNIGKSEEQQLAEGNARLNKALNAYNADKASNGIGANERQYDAITDALRSEATRLENTPIRSVSQANQLGKQIAQLRRAADMRDAERELHRNEWIALDQRQQAQKDRTAQERASAIQANLRATAAERKSRIDALVKGAVVSGIVLSPEDKAKVIGALIDGAGVTDENGRYVDFTGGEFNLPVRAYLFSDGQAAFIASGGE